jgi:hypothetical protein
MYYIPTVSYLTLNWDWNPATFVNIFQAWQNWVETLPNDISTIMKVSYANGRMIFEITALKANGEPFTEWENAFAKFYPEVKIFQGSYLDSSRYWAGQSELPFNKAKSKIMMKPLSNKVIKKIANYFQLLLHENPQITVFFEFEAFGGAISDFETSFYPRKAFGWWYQEYLWSQQNQAEQALAYSRKFYSSISPDVSIYSYTNTVDYDIGPYYLNAYYGDNALRLIQIKNIYDPQNLFHWTQSIPLETPIPGSLICQ